MRSTKIGVSVNFAPLRCWYAKAYASYKSDGDVEFVKSKDALDELKKLEQKFLTTEAQRQDFESKLNRQSTQLALALKEKNDALEKLQEAWRHIPMMYLDNEGTSVDVKTALQRWGADHHKIRDGLKASYQKEQQIRKELQEWKSQCTLRGTRIGELEQELKKLRPPEPKFRVGQVVVMTWGGKVNQPYRINGRVFKDDKMWWYEMEYMTHLFPERDIKALEEQEK